MLYDLGHLVLKISVKMSGCEVMGLCKLTTVVPTQFFIFLQAVFHFQDI